MKFLYSLALGLLLFSCNNEEQSTFNNLTDNVESSFIDENNIESTYNEDNIESIYIDSSEVVRIKSEDEIVEKKRCGSSYAEYKWVDSGYCGPAQSCRRQYQQKRTTYDRGNRCPPTSWNNTGKTRCNC